MKKFLRPKDLPVFTLLAAVLGFLVRLWALGAGPDSEGLYQSHPVAWTTLWVLSIVTMLVISLTAKRLKNPGEYEENFPKSVGGAVGCLLAAVGCMVEAMLGLLSGDMLWTVTGVVGILASVSLVVLAYGRFSGQKPNFFWGLLVCLFFAVRLFVGSRDWSNHTQFSVFLIPFFASAAAMFACYYLTCFHVDLGNRKSCVFWNLTTVYLCVLALPGGEDVFFYGAIAIWFATNLCSLKPIKKKETPKPEITSKTENTDTP